MKLKIVAIVFFFNSMLLLSQEKLSLTDCYQSAYKNHPLSEKAEILQRQTDSDIDVLRAQQMPKLDFEAQATYQSDVLKLSLPIPNLSVTPPDKDQYKATLTASKMIYNGGLYGLQKNLRQAQNELQTTDIQVQLHALKAQINPIYFNILLVRQKMLVLQQNINQLQDKKREIEKLIATGSTYESATEPIAVKILELQQNQTELQATQNQLITQLSDLTGIHLSENVVLESNVSLSNNQPRAEMSLFEKQQTLTEQQVDVLKAQTLPKISAFATAGYGKPGLNMLNNAFDDYYLAGVKLQWNVFDFKTNQKQRQATLIQKDIVENQKQVFEWNQNVTAENYRSEISKFTNLLQTDNDIINYRKKIVATAEKQLKHDLITTADYTAEINKLMEAQINQKTHEIQLALAQANLNSTLFD